MEIQEPEFRCGDNWEELATLFHYEIDKNDQDWTYIVAESERIDEYIQAYDTTVTNEDTKFSLVEMIIQALTDQASNEIMKEKWKTVRNSWIKILSLINTPFIIGVVGIMMI